MTDDVELLFPELSFIAASAAAETGENANYVVVAGLNTVTWPYSRLIGNSLSLRWLSRTAFRDRSWD